MRRRMHSVNFLYEVMCYVSDNLHQAGTLKGSSSETEAFGNEEREASVNLEPTGSVNMLTVYEKRLANYRRLIVAKKGACLHLKGRKTVS